MIRSGNSFDKPGWPTKPGPQPWNSGLSASVYRDIARVMRPKPRRGLLRLVKGAAALARIKDIINGRS
jgi:hypothetical protein